MTAYPVTCLVANEDGYRTVITLEEPSDADTEMGAIARLRIMTDDGKTLQVVLSPEAAEALERRLRELRGTPESVATSLETGTELHRRRQMTTTSDPTTPDAVSLVHELLYAASQQGPEETDQVADRLLSAIHSERARHAEEVARLRDVHLDETRALDDLRLKEIASLRDQLRRTEGARAVATRVAADHFETICQLRDQLRTVEGERDEAVAHRLNVATDGVSDPWRPIEECGELARGRYLVQLRSGAQLVALWSGDSEGWVLRQRDLDEFDSPRDITHVHQMGTIRGPGETDGNV